LAIYADRRRSLRASREVLTFEDCRALSKIDPTDLKSSSITLSIVEDRLVAPLALGANRDPS